MPNQDLQPKPIGGLRNILAAFEAPEIDAKIIAKRVGDIVGVPGGLTHDEVMDAIVMNSINGIPDWGKTINTLAEWAKDVRRIDW